MAIEKYENRIICGDNIEVMRGMPDNCIDLTVTSPPYDNLRVYKGYSFNFEEVAKELYRITKPGGVVVWVVGDATINGSETGTSFRQALYFKEIGFNLHDTMIWFKPNAMPQIDKSRFTQSFEYMFVLSKGKPQKAAPLMIPTKTPGRVYNRGDYNEQSICKAKINTVKPERIAFNVYSLPVGSKSYGHPAIFPEQLANDHIISWSDPEDLVFDPFVGSGTTCKMAILNGRKYLGIDISEEYCQIARKRIKYAKKQQSLKIF
jgi:DNA modification methylase